MSDFDTILRIVTAICAIGGLTGVWLAFRTLKANHDWQRRQYAMGIFRDWNDLTADHARAIEEAFPHIRDVDRTTGKRNEITKEKAKEIYTCSPDNKACWDLRFNIIELLNHLEFMATAYSQQVADHTIIVDAFKEPLTRWHDILKNFLEVVEQCEGYRPWNLLEEQVAEWQSVTAKHRKKTA